MESHEEAMAPDPPGGNKRRDRRLSQGKH